nr:MAG TPA: hypothetical protein [Caudoviricetes sp.]
MKMLKTLRLVETDSEVTISLKMSGRKIDIEMDHLDKGNYNGYYRLSDLIYPILSLRDEYLEDSNATTDKVLTLIKKTNESIVKYIVEAVKEYTGEGLTEESIGNVKFLVDRYLNNHLNQYLIAELEPLANDYYTITPVVKDNGMIYWRATAKRSFMILNSYTTYKVEAGEVSADMLNPFSLLAGIKPSWVTGKGVLGNGAILVNSIVDLGDKREQFSNLDNTLVVDASVINNDIIKNSAIINASVYKSSLLNSYIYDTNLDHSAVENTMMYTNGQVVRDVSYCYLYNTDSTAKALHFDVFPDFSERLMPRMASGVGSRNAKLSTFITSEGNRRISTGCFEGSLEEFKQRIAFEGYYVNDDRRGYAAMVEYLFNKNTKESLRFYSGLLTVFNQLSALLHQKHEHTSPTLVTALETVYRVPAKIYDKYAFMTVFALHDAAEAVVKEAEKSFSDKEDDFENGLTLI